MRAERAPVRPRVLLDSLGEPVCLERAIEPHLRPGARAVVELAGESGYGKTTALQHLAGVFAGAALELLDEPSERELERARRSGFVVFTTRRPVEAEPTLRLRLAGWGNDEFIEYLLVSWPEECRAVMRRIEQMPERGSFGDCPALWRRLLDELARDAALTRLDDALERVLARFATLRDSDQVMQFACTLACEPAKAATAAELPRSLGLEGSARQLLLSRPVQLRLARRRLVSELAKRGACGLLKLKLPGDMLECCGRAAAASGAMRVRLERIVNTAGRSSEQAMAASILQASGAAWTLREGYAQELTGATLPGLWLPCRRLARLSAAGADLRRANFSGCDLERARLELANLEKADLSGAWLKEAVLESACLRFALLEGIEAAGATFASAILEEAGLARADLTGASLAGANLRSADLSHAILRRATLLDARLDDANLEHAMLDEALLNGASLRSARLNGASFAGARMRHCDLEGVMVLRPRLRRADLRDAMLTGSAMAQADFEQADLRGAGLAQVEWPGADLRKADLRGAVFHLGSSRSGLVGSPIACEGSRTGFYDDAGSRTYQKPEQIRVANLTGAELSGAVIDDTDFYRVDLRGAKYSKRQAAWLRKCGAILDG